MDTLNKTQDNKNDYITLENVYNALNNEQRKEIRELLEKNRDQN